MSARALALCLLLPSGQASAYESFCYEYPAPEKQVSELPPDEATLCDPAGGPNTARQRWVGPLD